MEEDAALKKTHCTGQRAGRFQHKETVPERGHFTHDETMTSQEEVFPRRLPINVQLRELQNSKYCES